MRFIFPLVILSLLLVACNTRTDQRGKQVIATVGNSSLTIGELEAGIPQEISPEDSIILADKIIRQWIKDNLLYDLAKKNISDLEEINLLVENYRKSLMVFHYQEQLVNEKLSRDISDEEMLAYFDNNKGGFKLEHTLIKGLYLKVPLDAPQINDIRSWCKSGSKATLDKIEKYSVQNAVVYDYFYDRWVDFNDMMDNLPVHYNDPDATVKNNRYIELQDSSYYYFLNIKEYLPEGSDAPFEHAKPTVKEVLINQKKMGFLKELEDDLYDKAVEKGQVKFYTE